MCFFQPQQVFPRGREKSQKKMKILMLMSNFSMRVQMFGSPMISIWLLLRSEHNPGIREKTRIKKVHQSVFRFSNDCTQVFFWGEYAEHIEKTRIKKIRQPVFRFSNDFTLFSYVAEGQRKKLKILTRIFNFSLFLIPTWQKK